MSSSHPFPASVPGPDDASIPGPSPDPVRTCTPTSIEHPQDLLTAIPYFVQFQPQDTLVAVLVREQELISVTTMDFLPPLTATDFWELLSLDIAHAHADSLYLIAYVPES
ncbi:MAG TPA: hypothetical protein VLJ88_11665, partial [Propionibacteriaceae bacterium]|nr:hypothetical protein [Propionibacteriaceae bacterium]